MEHLWAVVMAGGSGTRFWPSSRAAKPKQLLPLADREGTGETLLAATVRRLGGMVPPERVVVVLSERLVEATAAALPEVPRENLLAEPVGRNTAPCVGWACAWVRRRDPDAVVAILAADHHIGDEPAYRAVIERAVATAERGELVTIGIQPTRPETGYGYIEVGDELDGGARRVARFVEKPTRERAEEFLATGRFLWNSGSFFFRADRMLAEIRKSLPDLADTLDALDQAAADGREQERVRALYPEIRGISIDHGVMEKASGVAVVPGAFGWSDVGSWQTAWELATKDEAGNAARGETVLVDASGCFVVGEGKKVVAVIGVQDLVVVDTPDALLVVPREQSQRVREVVEALQKRGRGDAL